MTERSSGMGSEGGLIQPITFDQLRTAIESIPVGSKEIFKVVPLPSDAQLDQLKDEVYQKGVYYIFRINEECVVVTRQRYVKQY